MPFEEKRIPMDSADRYDDWLYDDPNVTYDPDVNIFAEQEISVG